jgi:hypothetical protein
MGVYTEIIREVKNRLLVNLADCTVAVGYVDERLTADQERFCIIQPVNIVEAYGRARQENKKDANLDVIISCMKSIVMDSKENLYKLVSLVDGEGNNIADSEGFDIVDGSYLDTLLPYIEQVLDAINTQTDGTTLNPQLTTGAESMGITVDNFRAGADRVWFDVVLSIRTKPFDINNRQEK